MVKRFFESIYKGVRFVGMGEPDGSEPLQLYQTTLKEILASLKWQVNAEAIEKYLQRKANSLTISQDCTRELTLIPPLSADVAGDTLVSGFMQTHNIKIDQTQTDSYTPLFPNWFIKGLGSSLKVSGMPLVVPNNPIAICEEAEVVLLYLADEFGKPRYCGYTFGNDVTDIGFFKRKPEHLSYAKLCDAGISYWFYAAPPPEAVCGEISIERDGELAWQGSFKTGLSAMGYHLDNILDHLFSFPMLHYPNRVHYIYMGADKSSYHYGFCINSGDRVTMNFSSHNTIIENAIQFGL